MATISQRIAMATALATAIAIPAEGLRQKSYYDPPGILTVCFGHTGGVIKGKTYSLAECDKLLTDDMRGAISAVERCHPNLPANVLAAFGDAVYNIGPAVACNSTASRLLSSGDIDGACKQLPRWSYAKVGGVNVQLPGLVKRRNAEMKLCLGESDD